LKGTIWPAQSTDSSARTGKLAPVYGAERRWQEKLEAPVLSPPSRRDLSRYVVPMLEDVIPWPAGSVASAAITCSTASNGVCVTSASSELLFPGARRS
jgi:hypothetical protein